MKLGIVGYTVRFHTYTAEQVEETISAANPAVFDMLPLSLEEIFIYELGGEGHDADSILF